MEIIRAEDKALIPWKNGGGLTREIAVYFDPSCHADFLWRISMAVVDQAGAFSHFDGIDRSLAVLDGQGLILKTQTSEIWLERNSAPCCFAGELDIEAILPDGATTDLNVMTRRGFFRHLMEQCRFEVQINLEMIADTTFIVAKNAVSINGKALKPFDTATGFKKGQKIALQTQEAGEVFVISLFAC